MFSYIMWLDLLITWHSILWSCDCDYALPWHL